MQADPKAPDRRQQLQAILLAALCSVLFLRDALLPGRTLVPYPPELYDVQCEEAAARGALDLAEAARGNVAGGDKWCQSLCWDRVLQRRLRAFDVPLWTNDIAGGAAFVPQMAQVWQPINLLLWGLPAEQWYGCWLLIHHVLFGWFAYLFVRRLGTAHASGLFAVVAAVLGLWTQGKVHHNVILTAALSLWPMLTAVHALAHGGSRRWIAWLGLWTGLSWTSGFAVVSLQVSYLTVAFALLMCLRQPRGSRLRPLLRIAAGMLVGGLLSLCHMVPVLLAAAASARDPTFQLAQLAAHGLEWDHALSACWPDLLSWAGDRFYPDAAHPARAFVDPTRLPWSQLVLLHDPIDEAGSSFQNWIETTFSVSLPALACAGLSLLDRSRRALVWFFAGTALLGFLLATADQPFLTLARLLPGVAAADLRRLLFLTAMGLVVLTALGADRLLQPPRCWPAFAFLAAVAAVSLIALGWCATLEPETTFVDATASWIALDQQHPYVRAAGGDVAKIAAAIRAVAHPGEAAHNLAMLTATSLRALLVAAVAAAALLSPWPAVRVAACIGCGALELLHTGLGPVQTVAAARATTPPAVVQPVLAAPQPAPGVRPRLMRLGPPVEPRNAALYPPNLPGFQGLEDAAAYNPLPPARMEEFFLAIEPDAAEGAPPKTSVVFHGAGVGAFHDPASLRHPLCDLFGIRFVLTDQPQPASAGLIDRTPPQTGRFRLYERTTTLPKATFVRAVDLLPERRARLSELARKDRDVATRVVLEDASAPRPAVGGASASEVAVVRRDDERVEVRVRAAADGYLRLADPYDPGWTATIDAQPTRVYAADHYLRAVYVPAGEHVVVFAFDGARVVWPGRISLLALLVLGWLGRPIRRRPVA